MGSRFKDPAVRNGGWGVDFIKDLGVPLKKVTKSASPDRSKP